MYIYQTIKVGEKSYMIDWHRIPWRKSFAIPLVISMSRSTTKLTAGNIIELSISSFGDVSATIIIHTVNTVLCFYLSAKIFVEQI